MRVVLAIVALCAAYIPDLDRRHAEVLDSRRASRRAVRNCKIICVAAIAWLAWLGAASARPSPYPGVTQFVGDRYGSAQLGPEVIRGMNCPSPPCARGRAGKARYLYPTRKRPPVKRQRWHGPTPFPAPRPLAEPGVVDPLSVAGGAWREAKAAIIGGRPAGCPHRFCGCGASLHLFGRIIPTLNLAANWLRFPRAAPAPKMVAARRGHVFVLERHIAGDTWLVHDSNSGRGRTRLHPRSIAGYQIVNPHGGNS